MNLLIIAKRPISTRMFAGITIVSLLLSAFPAAFFVANAATDVIYTTSSLTVNTLSTTGDINASGYENLTLSFDFDASGEGVSANGLEPSDTFKYGYRFGSNVGTQVELGSLSGVTGIGTSELGSIDELSVPSAADNTSDLQFYFIVDSAGGTDTVAVRNIEVKGDEQGADDKDKKVDICHWSEEDQAFEMINVAKSSIGTAHGSTGSNDGDIVSPFDDYSGYNWDSQENQDIYNK